MLGNNTNKHKSEDWTEVLLDASELDLTLRFLEHAATTGVVPWRETSVDNFLTWLADYGVGGVRERTGEDPVAGTAR